MNEILHISTCLLLNITFFFVRNQLEYYSLLVVVQALYVPYSYNHYLRVVYCKYSFVLNSLMITISLIPMTYTSVHRLNVRREGGKNFTKCYDVVASSLPLTPAPIRGGQQPYIVYSSKCLSVGLIERKQCERELFSFLNFNGNLEFYKTVKVLYTIYGYSPPPNLGGGQGGEMNQPHDNIQ